MSEIDVGKAAEPLAYARAVGIVALSTAVAWLIFPYFESSNLIMVYLLGIVVAATRLGRGPSIVASILSVAAFDFFFVPPYLTFAVADGQYLVTFAVMLVVAIVISTLTVRTRQQADTARQRERWTAALYAMSREFASTRGVDDLLRAAVEHIGAVFGSEVGVFLSDAGGRLVPRAGSLEPPDAGTGDGPPAGALFLPLVASRGTIGMLGMRPAGAEVFVGAEQVHLLEAFAVQTALAIERAMLAEEAHEARLRAESERLRNTLLSSVSHDLRTPLATITGAASSLLESADDLDAAARRELLQAIHEEADRLNRLVNNLLDMTRLESGALHVRKEWHPLEEIVGAALSRMGGRLADRPVKTALPPDLPLVPLDGVLMEQVLINLLDNALKYTPAGSPIEIAAWVAEGHALLEVADRGPGVPSGEETRVFDKFYRGRLAGTGRGVGLGLAICRGVVEAHGGRISVENRPDGGVAFRVALPLADAPPEVRMDDG